MEQTTFLQEPANLVTAQVEEVVTQKPESVRYKIGCHCILYFTTNATIIEYWTYQLFEIHLQVCPDHSGGENCQQCDDGYARDPSSGSCIAIDTQSCECDPAGSINEEYLDGKFLIDV